MATRCPASICSAGSAHRAVRPAGTSGRLSRCRDRGTTPTRLPRGSCTRAPCDCSTRPRPRRRPASRRACSTRMTRTWCATRPTPHGGPPSRPTSWACASSGGGPRRSRPRPRTPPSSGCTSTRVGPRRRRTPTARRTGRTGCTSRRSAKGRRHRTGPCTSTCSYRPPPGC